LDIIPFFFRSAYGQNCATPWVPYNGKCWYFSDRAVGHEIGMTWTEAESWCRQNNAHLASFETAEERVSDSGAVSRELTSTCILSELVRSLHTDTTPCSLQVCGAWGNK